MTNEQHQAYLRWQLGLTNAQGGVSIEREKYFEDYAIEVIDWILEHYESFGIENIVSKYDLAETRHKLSNGKNPHDWFDFYDMISPYIKEDDVVAVLGRDSRIDRELAKRTLRLYQKGIEILGQAAATAGAATPIVKFLQSADWQVVKHIAKLLPAAALPYIGYAGGLGALTFAGGYAMDKSYVNYLEQRSLSGYKDLLHSDTLLRESVISHWVDVLDSRTDSVIAAIDGGYARDESSPSMNTTGSMAGGGASAGEKAVQRNIGKKQQEVMWRNPSEKARFMRDIGVNIAVPV